VCIRSRRCEAVAKKRLHVMQVGSAFVEEERRRRISKGCADMIGTRARSQASLMRALNARLLNGAPSRPGKINGDAAEFTPTPQPYAFHTFQKAEPFL
jgi:hypothetical protein